MGEKSPYLLQHAHNPVDWYPWGKEAFDLAKERDKPIFLSIGYATCHWCHVMAHESFENPDLAKMLNQAFVNIKVDREERPDIDDLYMELSQALMATPGGWPLNIILTPELKPFFAVTYLPPKTSNGMIGLDQFIMQISELWQSDERAQIIEQADQLVEILGRVSRPVGTELPSVDLIDSVAPQIYEAADPLHGGFKGEPKFPLSYHLLFLMACAEQKSEGRALFFAELTLDKMASGGIYDHLGGGFSRYSVDSAWQVPHFEKMLYDNALLVSAYLEGARVIKKERYRVVAKETLNYLMRELVSPEGAFYAAEDADMEGHEGLFYTWDYEEVKETLPPEILELFCSFYGIREQGNFRGRNILHSAIPFEEFAEIKNLSEVELDKRLQEGRRLLFEKRKTRTQPFKDDKILSGWNGLAIDAFAKAGKFFNEDVYTQAALKAVEFIKNHLWKEGFLHRRYRDGEARFHATLEEYAFLIKGVLTLYSEGSDKQWLDWAVEMTALLEKRFKAPGGAFYQTDGSEPLLVRRCGFFDGPEPSGNAVHTENLLRLYQITQEEKYRIQAEEIMKGAKQFIETYALGSCYHLLVLLKYETFINTQKGK